MAGGHSLNIVEFLFADRTDDGLIGYLKELNILSLLQKTVVTCVV